MKPETKKIPQSVRLRDGVEPRVIAFLKAHPSYSYADIENLALTILLNQIDAGAKIVDMGKGHELLNPAPLNSDRPNGQAGGPPAALATIEAAAALKHRQRRAAKSSRA